MTKPELLRDSTLELFRWDDALARPSLVPPMCNVPPPPTPGTIPHRDRPLATLRVGVRLSLAAGAHEAKRSLTNSNPRASPAYDRKSRLESPSRVGTSPNLQTRRAEEGIEADPGPADKSNISELDEDGIAQVTRGSINGDP